MNKHVKISLIVLGTIVLLLALTIPGLAKKSETYNCNVAVVLVSSGGSKMTHLETGYNLEAYWKDDILYNFCTGTIPFGEPHETMLGRRYATFDETCAYWGDSVTCDKNVISTDIEQWPTKEFPIFDPVTEENLDKPATYFSVKTHKNGKFLFYKEYVP
jgi:hypothetical protein